MQNNLINQPGICSNISKHSYTFNYGKISLDSKTMFCHVYLFLERIHLVGLYELPSQHGSPDLENLYLKYLQTFIDIR